MEEHQTVVLISDNTENGLKRGDIGAVVHIYEEQKAYEVEFISGDGKSVALLTLEENKIRSLSEKDIVHVRELATA